jgi:hypothetical protein
MCVTLLAFLGGLAVNHHAVTEAQGMNRVFELSTYTANEGKLPAPLAENTLVYMLAHENRDAARASWRAFGADPDWATMRDASEADGRLVSNVESIFLNPTDFSPAR